MSCKKQFTITKYLQRFTCGNMKRAIWGATRCVGLSLILTQAAFYSSAQAEPSGGHIVGGSGSIQQSGLTTHINQLTPSLAIDWNQFDIKSNEIVNFLQPGSSSIALNRILGGSTSEIFGQINANGQVVLVNPNGIFFGQNSSINVGGLIASGLNISPTDFMNGDYIFNEVIGSDGTVINNGIINASLGGNVALVGKQVNNEGVISARLGSVILATGRAAVLTFDQQGLLGVQVTEAVLQDELGIDPAVINSGEIDAQGGHVLLTASISQDVFSQAVNVGDLTPATSVVVHEDGTFTLGAGADVINTGLLNVSTTEHNQDAGQIVILGENVTSSGIIKADAEKANGGDVELHANNTALLTENSQTSARSENLGIGGVVNVLGHHVGLFDQVIVDVSGAKGGGQILIGGDYQGKNTLIRNAQRTFVDDNARIIADAINEGNGGKVIIWADESTQFYGDIFARGGISTGNGGFAEVSGKEGLLFSGFADLSAESGEKGTLLLDPKNIAISTDPTSHDFPSPNQYNSFNDIRGTDTTLNNVDLATHLNSANVELQANTDINVNADVIATSGSNNLTLDAGLSIIVADSVAISLNGGDFTATINHNSASSSNRDVGDAIFSMGTGSSITTNGGDITISTGTFDSSNQIGDFTLRNLSTSGADDTVGGAITLTNSRGAINLSGSVTANAGTTTIVNANGNNGGLINISAPNSQVSVGGNISSQGAAGNGTGVAGNNNVVIITGDTLSTTGIRIVTGGLVNITSTGGAIQLGDSLTLSAEKAGSLVPTNANDVLINDAIDYDGIATGKLLTLNAADDIQINGISDEDTTTVESLAVTLNSDTDDSGDGDISVNNEIHTGGAAFIATGATFDNNNNNGLIKTSVDSTSNVVAGTVNITTTGNIDLGAIQTTNEGAGEVSSGGGLTVKTKGGTIIQGAGVNLTNSSTTDEEARLIEVSGVSSFIASDELGTPTLNTIDLRLFKNNGDFGNRFDSSVSFTGDNVTVYADSGIDLGLSTIGGDLFVRSTGPAGLDGDIRQNDALTVGGQSTFVANGNSITLLDINNDFTGDVSVTNTGANAIQIRDVDDISLVVASLSVGDLTVTATQINLNVGSGIITNGGNATFNGPVVLQQASNTIDTGTGKIDFTSTVIATTDRGQSLTLTAGDIDFDGAVGETTRLGDLMITATGDVDASNNVIRTNSVDVVSSSSFTSGAVNTVGAAGTIGGSVTIIASNAVDITGIDTQGGVASASPGLQGGAVDLTGADITVGLINTSGSNASGISRTGGTGGAITLTAVENAGNHSITINNDLNALGGFNTGALGVLLPTRGTSGTVTLNLDNSGSPGGSIDIAHTGVFSNSITINGSTGVDTFNAPGRSNTWSAVTPIKGVLNSMITFNDFENLIGNSGVDTFTFSGPAIEGLIDGGGGVDVINLSSAGTTIQLGATTGIANNSILEVNNIENIVAVGNGNTLQGEDADTNWFVSATGAGSVGGNAITATPTEGTVMFSNFDTLTAGTGIDTLTGPNINTSWTVDSANGNTLTDTIITPVLDIAFSGMENLTSGSGSDAFKFIGSSNVSGTVDGGAGFDTIDLSGNSGSVTFNLAGGLNRRENFEEVSGNGDQSTLIASNNINIWNVNGTNSGIFNEGQADQLSFTGFNNLTGGTNTDTFKFTNAGEIVGLINGNGNSGIGVETIDLTAKLTVVDVQVSTLPNQNTNSILELTGIEQINANAANANIIRSDASTPPNNWVLDGDKTGLLNTALRFNGFTILTGTDAMGDVFNLGPNAVNFNIFGGAGGIDEIRSTKVAATTWNITGAYQGNISDVNGANSFQGIENLTGAIDTDDRFILAAGGTIGTVDGGAGIGNDKIVNQQIIDTIWNINGTNQGDVAGISNFTEIENLTGGTADDRFVYTNTGDITGTIDGGGQTLADIMDYFGVTDAVNVNLVTDVIINIERLMGNDSDSTLTGANSNVWVIDGNNDGTINTTLAFENFNNLIGGSGADTFNVLNTGTVTGLVNGSAGDDVVNVTLSSIAINTGGFTFDGGADNDTITITGGDPANVTAQYDSNVSGFERLTYTQTPNNYTVDFIRAEEINDNVMAASLTVNGTAGDDTINLGTGRFTVNSATNINSINKTNLIVNALGGSDAIDMFENINLGSGQVTLTAETVTHSNNAVLTAETLALDTVNTVGAAGNSFKTDITSLNLNDINGEVYINDLSGLSLDQLTTVAGIVELTAQSGDIQNTVDLNSNTTNLDLIALNGNINLSNVIQLNSLDLSATDITIDNGANALTVNDVTTSGTVTLTATGMTLNGDVNTSGDTTLDAQTGNATINGSLVALNAANLIVSSGTINQNSIITSRAGDINLSASGAITMASGSSTNTTTGNIGYQAGGDIRATSLTAQAGNLSIGTTTQIIDGNGETTNFIADTLTINAITGIGNNDGLETRVSVMDVRNTGSGNIILGQIGPVELVALQNTGSSGDIDFTTNADIRFNPGSVNAALGSGNLIMRTTQGSFLGLGTADLGNPDITAQNATFIGRSGTFGDFQRFLTLNVPGSVFIDTRGVFNPLFVPPGPSSLESNGIDFTVLGAITAVAGEQLVEVESLSEIDPAIFTDLKNYSLEELSIRMPRDQIFEDELEEYERDR